ncbi:MAG TPA: hypothetical protein DCR53_17195, partial [Afipia sp.]|nr:hypothetical protein [Afipia sp.]
MRHALVPAYQDKRVNFIANFVHGGEENALFSPHSAPHIPLMAKNPDSAKKPPKTPKSKAHRPDVQPIGPALAELLNPAINRGDAGMG